MGRRRSRKVSARAHPLRFRLLAGAQLGAAAFVMGAVLDLIFARDTAGGRDLALLAELESTRD